MPSSEKIFRELPPGGHDALTARRGWRVSSHLSSCATPAQPIAKEILWPQPLFTWHPVSSLNRDVASWVEEVARLTQPDRIHWCDGSDAEYLKCWNANWSAKKDLLPLNASSFPGCYLHRSNPIGRCARRASDLSCAPKSRDDAGPNNHWMAPADGHAQMDALFCRLHEGPYAVCGAVLHGPDRLGVVPLRRRDHRQRLCGAQHEAHDPHGPSGARAHRARRHVREGLAFHRRARSEPPLHHAFPRRAVDQEFWVRIRRQRAAWKEMPCALRIASWQARTEGWLAEHMLIVGIENPQRRDALPRVRISLGMRQDQSRHADSARRATKGWKVWTVGDDIAWLHPGKGRKALCHQS